VSEPEGQILRWREAFAGLSERAVPGPACPEPDRLWAAATAEAPVAERQEIVAHMATCASCAGAFRLAMGLSRGQSRGQSQEQRVGAPEAELLPFSSRPLASRPWFRRTAPLAALAAALLLAVLVPTWWRGRPAPPYRGAETMEIRSEIAEGAVLLRHQAVLRWAAGPPGSRYEVRVLTREAREVAVETDLEAPRYQIPPAALAGISTNTILYWQVKTRRPDGTNGVSKTFSVRLR
jgi:hypothetical protein